MNVIPFHAFESNGFASILLRSGYKEARSRDNSASAPTKKPLSDWDNHRRFVRTYDRLLTKVYDVNMARPECSLLWYHVGKVGFAKLSRLGKRLKRYSRNIRLCETRMSQATRRQHSRALLVQRPLYKQWEKRRLNAIKERFTLLRPYQSFIGAIRIGIITGQWWYTLDIPMSRTEAWQYLDFIQALREAEGAVGEPFSGDDHGGGRPLKHPPREVKVFNRWRVAHHKAAREIKSRPIR